MASPQLENGYMKLAIELLEKALCTLRAGTYEWNILMVVLRRTYGFNKLWDTISLSQFSRGTGILPQHCASTKKLLLDRNIIKQRREGNRIFYGIQKDYTLWKPRILSPEILPIQVLPDEVLPKEATGTTSIGTDGSTSIGRYNNIFKKKNMRVSTRDHVSKKETDTGAFKECIQTYHDLYLKKFSAKPKINAADGKNLKDLLTGGRQLEEVARVMKFYFEHPTDFVEKKGLFGLRNVVGDYNQTLARMKAHQESTRSYG